MMPRACSEATASIRALLVANVAANLFFVEPNGRDRITSSPEMLSSEVPFFALHSSNGDRALALDKSNHRSDRMFGRDRDTHMHMIQHQMSFNELALFLLRQFMEDLAEMFTNLPIQHLAAIFGDKNNMVFAIPLRMGQALVSIVQNVLLLG